VKLCGAILWQETHRGRRRRPPLCVTRRLAMMDMRIHVIVSEAQRIRRCTASAYAGGHTKHACLTASKIAVPSSKCMRSLGGMTPIRSTITLTWINGQDLPLARRAVSIGGFTCRRLFLQAQLLSSVGKRSIRDLEPTPYHSPADVPPPEWRRCSPLAAKMPIALVTLSCRHAPRIYKHPRSELSTPS
jgi:hypothetical protein